jgi:hypothetical protein
VNFQQFILILRARYKIMLSVAGVVIATTLIVSLLIALVWGSLLWAMR